MSLRISHFETIFFFIYKLSIFLFFTLLFNSILAQEKPDQLAKALLDSSDAYDFSNPDSCLFLIQEAGEVLKPYNDLPAYSWMTGKYLTRLGNHHRRIGNYEKAIGYFQEAIVYFEQAKEVDSLAKKAKKGIGTGYHNSAATFATMENYQKAIELYKKAWNIYLEVGDSLYAAGSYGGIGAVYSDMDSLEQSFDHYKLSLQIVRKLNAQYEQGVMTHNMGILLVKMEAYDSAISYFNQSMKISIARNNIFRLASIHYQLGNIYFLNGEYLQALDYAKQSLDYAKQVDFKKTQSHILLLLGKIHDKLGNHENAYKYLIQHTELEKSLFASEIQKNTLEIQTKYETEKKETQLAHEKQKNKLAKIITYLTVLGSCIIISLLINRLLAQRKINKISQEKFQTEMDYKNRLLTSKTLDLANFSNLLSNLDTKIDESKNDSPEQLRKNLKNSISSNLRDISDWEQMKIHFEEVHPKFFENISQIEPALTPNEQKHCAFIKMKIDNKDIARMLNVNLSSVHVVHHRLKKKLGLGEESSLAVFVDHI